MTEKTLTTTLSATIVVLVAAMGFGLVYYTNTVSELESRVSSLRATQNTTEATTTTNSTGVSGKVSVKVDETSGVTYTDTKGKSTVIAKNVSNQADPVQNRTYQSAKISPNGKFVAMLYSGWEVAAIEVYDIATGETHKTEASSGTYQWLDTGKLRLDNEAGIATNKESFESTSADKPWEVAKVSK